MAAVVIFLDHDTPAPYAWLSLIWAAAFPIFRAPESGLPPMLRVRNRARRAVYRLVLILGTAAGVTATTHNPGWTRLLAASAAVLIIAEPFLWQAGTRALGPANGRRVRQLLLDNRSVEESRKALSGPRIDLTVKRPRPRPQSAAATRKALAFSPSRSKWAPTLHPKAGIHWHADVLTVIGNDGRPLTWPTSPGGISPDHTPERVVSARVRPADSGPATDTVVEIAAVAVNNGIREVYLLDAECRRVGVIPAAGYRGKAFSRIAESAGIGYALYEIRCRAQEPDDVVEALFPRSLRQRRVPGPNRAWPAVGVWQWQSKR